MDSNNTDLAKAEPGKLQVAPASPMAMAMELCKVNSDMSIEKMEKILKMEREFQADQARKEFAADFAVVQANIDAVVNTKYNKQTSSNYSGLEDVLRTAKPVYTEHGFSVIYYEGETEKENHTRICADVLHKSGHKETYHYDIPLDGVGIKGNANMTKIHGKASSVTYGRRYLLCMIWNIPTQDADGNPPPAAKGPPEPTPEEQKALDAMCDAMVDSVPDGLTLDRERVAKVVYAIAGHYPDGKKTPGVCAAYLIAEINKDNSWATVTKKA